MIQIRREFASDPRQLAELRGLVRDCCQQAWGDGIDDERLDRIELAVQEAAANIARHSYGNSTGRPIRLELDVDRDRLSIALYHDGDDFDPTVIPPPSFDGSRSGGFGVYLIQQCMDAVCYVHGPPGPCGIRMVKLRATPVGDKPMNLFVESFGDVVVATVNVDQLDVGVADDMKLALETATSDVRKVVLDMQRVEFIDSRGCGVLLSCLKRLAERGGDLKLCCVTKPVRTVFDLIRLYKMCEITVTREQAIAAFR